MDFFERLEKVAKAVAPNTIILRRVDPEVSGGKKYQLEIAGNELFQMSAHGDTPDEAMAFLCFFVSRRFKKLDPIKEALRQTPEDIAVTDAWERERAEREAQF